MDIFRPLSTIFDLYPPDLDFHGIPGEEI